MPMQQENPDGSPHRLHRHRPHHRRADRAAGPHHPDRGATVGAGPRRHPHPRSGGLGRGRALRRRPGDRARRADHRRRRRAAVHPHRRCRGPRMIRRSGAARMPALLPAALPALLALLPAAAGAQGLAAALGPLADGFGTLAGGVGNNAVLLVVAMTALSLAPGIAITVTCFPFIVTVFSILRSALGLQQSPPNMLIVALSIFLTWFIMDPVLREIWASAGQP